MRELALGDDVSKAQSRNLEPDSSVSESTEKVRTTVGMLLAFLGQSQQSPWPQETRKNVGRTADCRFY